MPEITYTLSLSLSLSLPGNMHVGTNSFDDDDEEESSEEDNQEGFWPEPEKGKGREV